MEKHFMSEHDLNIVKAMNEYGSDFVQALSDCFFRADPVNFLKLKATFSDYWVQYEMFVNNPPQVTAGKQ